MSCYGHGKLKCETLSAQNNVIFQVNDSMMLREFHSANLDFKSSDPFKKIMKDLGPRKKKSEPRPPPPTEPQMNIIDGHVTEVTILVIKLVK